VFPEVSAVLQGSQWKEKWHKAAFSKARGKGRRHGSRRVDVRVNCSGWGGSGKPLWHRFLGRTIMGGFVFRFLDYCISRNGFLFVGIVCGGFIYLAPGTWKQVAGTMDLLPGTWYRAPGNAIEMPEICHNSASTMQQYR